jgi:hypothetical protein
VFDRHERTTVKQRTVRVNCCQYEFTDGGGYRILCSNLNDAWTLCMRDSENIAEVQIMREDYESVLASVRHDQSIWCAWITDGRPMLRLDASGSEVLNPQGAEIHVDHNLHDDEMGTSNSSDRHAAYARASEMSSDSRYG